MQIDYEYWLKDCGPEIYAHSTKHQCYSWQNAIGINTFYLLPKRRYRAKISPQLP